MQYGIFLHISGIIGVDCFSWIKHMLDKMDNWLVPEDHYVPVTCDGPRPFEHKQPEGSCLVIGAWDYPILPPRAHFLGVIAAGCTGITKLR